MATPPDTDAAAPKRELAAIMFSDITRYTAIMGRDEQEGLEARNSHRELLRTILPGSTDACWATWATVRFRVSIARSMQSVARALSRPQLGTTPSSEST